MPTILTKAAASAQGFGFSLGGKKPVYVEDVFSTYIYDGTGAAQTITNNIDLSTKGGLVWTKSRSTNYLGALVDTIRGATNYICPSITNGSFSGSGLSSFNTNGYTLSAPGPSLWNTSGQTYVGWSFRKQPKFFTICSWTGDGNSPRQIAHDLNAVPGMIIVKRTDTSSDWIVWNAGLTGATYNLILNDTSAQSNYLNFASASTSTYFSVNGFFDVNNPGGTYIAYLFAASNSGGFGLTGSDSVVACGGYTGGTDGTTFVNLGWEPQLVLLKRSDANSGWAIVDNMRGFPSTGASGGIVRLTANTSDAEITGNNGAKLSSTGFYPWGNGGGDWNASGGEYIYLAIRRGPMKVPTSGTSVFNPTATSASSGTIITTSVTADLSIIKYLDGNDPPRWNDRLRGYANAVGNGSPLIRSDSTAAEAPSATGAVAAVGNTGFTVTGALGGLNSVYYSFRRAPGFMDEVCYTVSGSPQTLNHNLGVVPELIIVKDRSAASPWYVWSNSFSSLTSNYLNLNNSQAVQTYTLWGTMSSTTIQFQNGTPGSTNDTAVAYLFATCAGVSKVGSYTGTGAAQNINCGFSSSARFILIKRTDSTGDWYTYDSARGISSGTDPYLLLNSTAAEVTGTDYVNTYSSGFALTSSAPADLNANGGTYIFLAIA